MKRILIHLSALLLAISAAGALASGAPAPDVGAGKQRAAVCFACHGADGISRIPGTPHLAGQERSYLEHALRAYRDGQTRQNPTMNAMAKALSERDIVNVAAYFNLQTRMSNGQTAAQALDTILRIRPVATTVTEAPAPAPQAGGAARSGEAVFQASCTACHATGAAGAPKLGDKAAWAPRLARGTDQLAQHALRGFNAMPAKGGCTDCTETEIRAAVDYLSSKAK